MAVDTQGFGIILQCIRGELWPLTSFSLTFDMRHEEPTLAGGQLTCHAGHAFTLEQAVRRNLLSREGAQQILAGAQDSFAAAKREYAEREAEGWRAKPSNYVPNKEVVEAGWPCKKCGARAQWAPGSPKEEERALCLLCRADWDNFWTDNCEVGEVFEHSTARPYWRPRELLDKELWERFLQGKPPITKSEAEELLLQFQEKARQEARERARLRRQAKKNKQGTL